VRLGLALALLALGLGVLTWQITRAGPEQVLQLLRTVAWPWIAAIVLLTAARYGVSAWRLAALSRRLWPVPWWPYVTMVLASQLVVTIAAPGLRVGATYLRAHLAGRRFGGGTARHLGPNVLDQLLLGVSWLLVALALVPVEALSQGRSPLSGAGLGLLAAAAGVTLAFVLFLRSRERLAAWLAKPRPGWRGRAALGGAKTLEGAGALASDPVALVIGLGGGVAFVLLAGVVQLAALHAVGHPVSPWLAILAATVGITAGSASGSPGGLGVTEATQVAFLQSQGVPGEAAAASVLLLRGVYYGFVIVAGTLAMAWEAWHGRLEGLLGGLRASPSEAASESAENGPRSSQTARESAPSRASESTRSPSAPASRDSG
jgi:uncharacterized membrane protein YbhN (UPF0104 family)